MEYDKEIFSKLGISYLKPYQELIISQAIDGMRNRQKINILGCLPTGSGKTLCFMYPILLMKKRTVLVYPLLSLMNDQRRRFEKAGIPHVILRGGLDRMEKARIINEIRDSEYIAIITNVETLLSMMRKDRLSILCNKTEMVVIDEAHTAVTWGESFRESYLHLPEIINMINPKAVMAFTATMNKRIEEGIIKYVFSSTQPYIVHESLDRENIFYHSVKCLSKHHEIIRILKDDAKRPAIIFAKSRAEAEDTASNLRKFFSIKLYHAGLSREGRKEIEDWFSSSSDGVLSATKAYGMGVDKKNIRTVIHTSLPESASDFLQEAGRGGRDGRRMDSYVLWYMEEDTPLSYIFKGKKCLRTSLLKEMNEIPEYENCLACSNCQKEDEPRAGEKEILSFIKHHPGIKPESAAAVLTSRNVFLRSRRLPDWTVKEVSKALGYLEEEGRIRIVFHRVFPIRRRFVKKRNPYHS